MSREGFERPMTREEAVEKALLYVFQLSGKDYRKMRTALSEDSFIRALEQDGWTIARLRDPDEQRRATLRRVIPLAEL